MIVNDEQFKQIIKDSNNISDVCRKLNIKICQRKLFDYKTKDFNIKYRYISF